MTSAAGPRRAAALGALLAATLLAGGCASARHALRGEEARAASGFFAAAAGSVRFPVVASYSGAAEFSGRVVPFVAGVSSPAPDRETVGVYDPLGRAVLLLDNAGGEVSVTRGPAADALLPGELRRVPDGKVVLRGDGFSLGRILSGAPGFPVSGGELFEVAFLPGLRRPMLLNRDKPATRAYRCIMSR